MRPLFWIIILSASTSYARVFSDKEMLGFFKSIPVCAPGGISYGFGFSNLDGSVGVKGNIVKLSKDDKCAQVPEGYVASLIEKNECDARIVIHPKSLSAEQARYLSSPLHTQPYQPGLTAKLYFNPKENPFRQFKEEWDELGKMRTEAAKQPSAKAITEKYAKAFKSVTEKTLASMQLKASDIEIVTFAYMGCH